MRLVVDGVFFQLNNTGIARVWDTILRIIVRREGWQIFMLDRGGAPQIDGIINVPFPAYKAADVAADSLMIQNLCDHLKADAFTSTYYTSPTSTPMTLMVYDMIPEIFDFDMSLRGWMEKETAIAYAQNYICISECTRQDLIRFYPEINFKNTCVSYCGVNDDCFSKRQINEVNEFRRRFGLMRDYFLFVGSRVQHKSYKNSGLFFRALKGMKDVDFDVFCVGGEPKIEEEILHSLPESVICKREVLGDYDLSLAYAGATALVYPSLYEGFGMPVIEAMASGCPVITTHHGSLAEAAGDAALLISGHSEQEMIDALTQIRAPETQRDLRSRGLTHAAKFRWEPMAQKLCKQIEQVVVLGKEPATQAFFTEWTRLRKLQADVDYL